MGDPDRERAIQEAMARIALERNRVCLPVLVFALAASLVLSGPLGVPVTRFIMGLNAVLFGYAACLWFIVTRKRIAARFGHVLFAAMWLIGPIATLLSALVNEFPGMALPLMIELTAAAMMTSTIWFVATTSAVVALWIPIAIRDGGANTGLYIGCVLGCHAMAAVVQLLIRHSLIRAERLRLAQVDETAAHRQTAERLACELDERRRAEDERERLRDQFVHAQRMEAVGTLAAGLAHDMNNILAGMLGIVEAIRDDSAEAGVRADCDAILREGYRGAELTRGLLAFSRRGQYQRKPIAVEDAIDDLALLLKRTLPKTISVERRGGTEAVVDADAAQLGQALMNLCLNAADAMGQSGTLTITSAEVTVSAADAARLGLAADRRWVMLAVADTGQGMDDATRRRIFEPFFTTKGNGKGTGLGLAMAYGAVKGHDGAIDVETARGAGTTFRIYLPIADAVPISAPTRPDTGRFRRSRMVLVVDDEPQVRAAATRMLERMGLAVVGADNGAEALEVYDARRDEIALVVLDMSMPVMGGSEFFHALRSRSRVPVLVASGYAQDHEAQELLAAGVIGFLEKPYTAAQLGEYVERVIER